MSRALTRQFASLVSLAEQRLSSGASLLSPQCSSVAQQWLRPAGASALQQTAFFSSTEQFKVSANALMDSCGSTVVVVVGRCHQPPPAAARRRLPPACLPACSLPLLVPQPLPPHTPHTPSRPPACCPQKQVHNAGPRSLEFPRQPAVEAPSGEGRGFAVKALLALGGYYSRESSNMRAAKLLYTAVTEQAGNPQFLQGE